LSSIVAGSVSFPARPWLQGPLVNKKPGQVKVFVWEDGKPFTERDFYEHWHAARKPDDVTSFVPHDSRRSASRNMRNKGIPRPLRKKIIGHKTDSMDERYGIVDIEDAQGSARHYEQKVRKDHCKY
jgi:integrase